MAQLVGIATACALLLLACLTAAQAQAALPGANGKIAFTRGAPSGIWTMDPDGSDVTPVLQNAAFPAWSPDGTKLTFSRGGEIWVAGADGGNPTRLTTRLTIDTDDMEPAWSPDGTRIAFVRSKLNVRSSIWAMDADGRHLRRLTAGNGYPTGLNYSPSWSPDGSKIVFDSHNSGGSPGLWVMNADGTNQTPLYLSNNGPVDPDWSPDGTRIAFIDGSPLAVMNSDGQNLHYLGRTGRAPAWSPDGSKLTFTDRIDPLFGRYAIWGMGADGSNPTRLSDPPPGSSDALSAWQPLAVTRSPWSIAFPSQPDSTQSSLRTVTLTNGTGDDVAVEAAALVGPDVTSFQAPASRDNCTGATVAPGGGCTVQVRFQPDGVGPKSASLRLSYDGPGSPQSVALSGTGTPGPWLTTTPQALKFGQVLVGMTTATKTVTLTNTGSAAMTISEIALEGANPGNFVGLSETCTSLVSLRPDRSCSVQIAFRPTATGSRTATLTITDTAPRSPHRVKLSGWGS